RPLPERLIGGEDLDQDRPHGAAVHHSVVHGPDQTPIRLPASEERHPDQRRPLQVDTTPAVRAQKRLEELLLVGPRTLAPILLEPFQVGAAMGLLQGCRKVAPAEAGAIDRIPLDDPLPGALERLRVQLLFQRAYNMEDLDARIVAERAMEEHAFLKW